MSGDYSYSASLREAADSDHGATLTRSARTGLADAPPAEPMSRAEYADYMRQRPVADDDSSDEDDGVPGHSDDSWGDAAGQAQGMTREQYASRMHQGLAAGADDHDTGDDHDLAASQPGDSNDEPRQADPAEQAQGMTRSQYADLMRYSPAAGEDAPGFVGTGDHSDPDGEPGASQPGSATDAGQLQATSQAAADLHPAGHQAERLTHGAAIAENDGNAMAPDSPSAGASADTTSVAGAGGGERPHDAPEADQASHDPPAASGTEEGVPSRHAAPAHEATGHEAPPGGEHGDAFTGQAAQPDEDHAVPDTPPQAGLKQQLAGLRDQMQAQVDERLQAAETRHQASLDNLKAEYEAGKAQDRQQIDDLRTELQALKDERPQPAPDAPGNTGMEADQPRLDDRELPEDQQNPEEPEHQDDRPGLWSNAKSVLYGAVGSTIGLAAADQFMPNVPHSVVDIATGAISLAGLLVPVAREGWKKRKHDNSPTKP